MEQEQWWLYIYQDYADAELLKKALASKATDILVIYNLQDQHKYVHEHLDKNILQDNRILEIFPKDLWKLSRFETKPKVLKKACLQMGHSVFKVFGKKDKKIKLK